MKITLLLVNLLSWRVIQPIGWSLITQLLGGDSINGTSLYLIQELSVILNKLAVHPKKYATQTLNQPFCLPQLKCMARADRWQFSICTNPIIHVFYPPPPPPLPKKKKCS